MMCCQKDLQSNRTQKLKVDWLIRSTFIFANYVTLQWTKFPICSSFPLNISIIHEHVYMFRGGARQSILNIVRIHKRTPHNDAYKLREMLALH
jgi:hypothetical protein